MAEAKNGGKKVKGSRAADVIDMRQVKTMGLTAFAEGRYSAALLISLCGALGLRISDARKLTWADILDENGKAREKVALVERKNKAQRVVYPMPWAKRLWEQCFAVLRPSDLGAPILRLSRQRGWTLVREMAAECGYSGRISPHSLRKAFCSLLYDQTRDPVLTARLTGHRNPAHLLRYIGRSAPVEEAIWKSISTMEI